MPTPIPLQPNKPPKARITSLSKRKLNSSMRDLQFCSGTTALISRNPPFHLKDAVDFEPLYPPQEFILEESLRREAERVAHQENLMNRVVYDCIDPSPYTGTTQAIDPTT